MDIYNLTLFNFQGEVLSNEYYEYKEYQFAIARAAKLIWEIDECARVIVKTDMGFHMTIEWGARRDY